MDHRDVAPDRRPAPRARAVSATRQEVRRAQYGFLVLPLLLIVLLLLSACASISEEECLAADWYSIGVEDGAKGYPLSRISSYRKDCAEVGVAPDAEQYGEGRMVGLESFCTYERGYSHGKQGYRNQAVCPPGPLEADFAEGYNAGRYVYDVNQNIRGLERDLADLRQEMDQIRADLDNGFRLDTAGNKRQIGKYERDAMYERLLALSKDEGRLENEIAGLRASIAGS